MYLLLGLTKAEYTVYWQFHRETSYILIEIEACDFISIAQCSSSKFIKFSKIICKNAHTKLFTAVFVIFYT